MKLHREEPKKTAPVQAPPEPKAPVEPVAAPADQAAVDEEVFEGPVATEEPVVVEAPCGPSELELARAEAEKARADLDALQDRNLRTLAEFDNYKRRTLRERDQMIESAAAGIMRELVDVRESFERALKGAGASAATNHAAVYDGMRLIFTSFDGVLSKHGLVPYGAEGEEFDPVVHDAMMRMPHATIPDGHVAQVLERGYRLRGTVLKHARVLVSSGAPPPVAPVVTKTETELNAAAAQDGCGDE
jgi:molecular chaperone GrpE